MASPLPPKAVLFPRDYGSHPDHRIEWWYITGHVLSNGRTLGFQVTFFRSRIAATQDMASAFAARQLLFAHAAVTDVGNKKIWHDQRIARQGFGIAEASETDTRIRLRDWSLLRETASPALSASLSASSVAAASSASRYTANIKADSFALALIFNETQPVLLQGNNGLSRKGPEAAQASYYYSQPQLTVAGSITLENRTFPIDVGTGTAWLDHEWSNALLHPDATGWDWIGMNLYDGSALTAFHLRRKDGSLLWAGGSFRGHQGGGPNRDNPPVIFGPDEVVFTPVRYWQSELGGTATERTRYPVEWQVRTPVGQFTVRALVDNQELDSRASTGAIYWEGLSDLLDSTGKPVGRGYLEMTGYAQALRL